LGMLREWFEHGGCIDLDKISEYIAASKAYSEASGLDDTRWIDWQLGHKRSHEERDGKCECSPPTRLLQSSRFLRATQWKGLRSVLFRKFYDIRTEKR